METSRATTAKKILMGQKLFRARPFHHNAGATVPTRWKAAQAFGNFQTWRRRAAIHRRQWRSQHWHHDRRLLVTSRHSRQRRKRLVTAAALAVMQAKELRATVDRKNSSMGAVNTP